MDDDTYPSPASSVTPAASTRARIAIASGTGLDGSAHAALAASDLAWAATASDIAVMLPSGSAGDPTPTRLTAILSEALAHHAPSATVRVVRPSSLLAAGFGRRRTWTDVAIGEGAERIERVRVPRALVAVGARCLVGALPTTGAGTSTRPLAALAAYVHPRQRLAARLANRPALLADLALPVRPRFLLLAGAIDGRPLAIATPDLIAAELVWLALRPEEANRAAIGAWQDAAVQRATELDLGVRIPARIDPIVSSAVDDADNEFLTGIVDRLRLRLGLP